MVTQTSSACVQLIEKAGAKVSAVVNFIEKPNGARKQFAGRGRAVLGTSGLEPDTPKTCKLAVNELLKERLDPPGIMYALSYEAHRSLSSVQHE